MKKAFYTEQLATPPLSRGHIGAYMAMAIVLRFGGRTPTHTQLQESFGMSKATAYRWIGGIKAAKGEA